MSRTFFTGPVIAAGFLAAGAAVAMTAAGPVDPQALLVLIVSCFAAILIAVVSTRWLKLDQFIARRLFPPPREPVTVLASLLRYAEYAYHDGLQGLGKRLDPGEDPLIRRGVFMAAAGTMPDRIRDVLDGDLDAMMIQRPGGRRTITALFRIGPMVGLFGLILCAAVLLFHRSAPGASATGSLALFLGLTASLLTTLLLGPACEALARGDAADVLARTIIGEGIVGIRNREHPRAIETRLRAMLPGEGGPRIEATAAA